MKELLFNIITKIYINAKRFIINTVKKIKFENRKSSIINVMYDPLIEEKRKEIDNLKTELKKLKENRNKINEQIIKLKDENADYNEKIKHLQSFRNFILNKRF